MKRGNEGYVLGWVIITMMVMMLFFMSDVTLSKVSYGRSILETQRSQAYYTARSAVAAAASALTEGPCGDETLEGILSKHIEEEGNYIFPIEVEGLEDMADRLVLRAEYSKDSGILKLTADASYGKGRAAVYVKLRFTREGEGKKELEEERPDGENTPESPEWQVLGFGT